MRSFFAFNSRPVANRATPDVAFSFAMLYVLDAEPTQLLNSRA
jgi:hypothetical protein